MSDHKRLCRMLDAELDKIEDKGNLSAGDLEAAHKLSDTKKNILKIEMLEQATEGYSQTGRPVYYHDEGMSYDRGSSNQRRNSMGRYSNDGGYSRAESDMMAELDEWERQARDDRERDAIREFRRKMQR